MNGMQKGPTIIVGPFCISVTMAIECVTARGLPGVHDRDPARNDAIRFVRPKCFMMG
jgi:hypothetical protein